MSLFRGGPAAGETLLFSRGPLYLRVVVGEGGFDVLDQLGDQPLPGEVVYVYRRVGESRQAHINNRGSRTGPRSGWYEFADYVYVEVDEETRARIRATASWHDWVDEQVAAVPASPVSPAQMNSPVGRAAYARYLSGISPLYERGDE